MTAARIPRKHLQPATSAPVVVTPVIIVPPSQSSSPSAGQESTRDASLTVTDTAMGTIVPINLGRFRQVCKLVHFDIIGNTSIEMVALIGEGPIDGVENIWLDQTEVYPTPPSWVTSLVVRTGTLTQTPPGNITNTMIAQLAWPGYAYVSIRVNLQTAPINGGMPRVEVAGRGLLAWDYANPTIPAPDFPTAWTENPIACFMALMRSPDFGCGLSKSMLDALEDTPGKTWYDAALGCDVVVDRLLIQPEGNTNANTSAGTDYDRMQVFTAPNDSFAVQVKIQVLDHGLDGKGWNDIFQLRVESYSGTPQTLYPIILPDGPNAGWTCSLDGSTPATPVPISGPGDYYLTAWYGNDIAQANQGRVYVSGTSYYLVMPVNAHCKWYLNTMTNAYLRGNAAVKSGSWAATNYDYWFRTAVAEKMFRLELIITQRQPIEQAVIPILQVCNGRWGYWDGLYRVMLDHLASGTLLLSDQESDNPDILATQGTMQCTRSTPEVPNVAIGDYLDTITWNRAEVSVQWQTVTEGLDQPRELRLSVLAVPSGDQMYRLLSTWLARGRRTWHTTCSVPQHGIRLHPGMLVQLKSRLFASTKLMIVDTVTDNSHGTFDVALLEYAASDYCMAAYVPQTVVNTVTQLPSVV